MNIADLVIGTIVLVNGAAIGSFLNVVIYRVPAGLSVISPPSRCPKCLNKLGPRENIPVLGWLMLGGRCRHCKTTISIRYPLVEAATGLLFLAVYLTFGLSVQTIGYCLFLAWLIALSLIDLDTMTLPQVLTRSLLILGLIFQVVSGYLATNTWAGAGHSFMQGIWGMLLGIWLYDGIRFGGTWLFNTDAQGDGDAKLMAGIGAWLGWKSVLLGGFLASGIGTLVMGMPMLLNWLLSRLAKNRSTVPHLKAWQRFPFGPFLALGGTIYLFAGEKIITAYQEFGQTVDRDSLSILLCGASLALLGWLWWVRRRRLTKS